MKRPISITVLAWAFVAVGSVGFVAGLMQLMRVSSTGGFASLNRHYMIESTLVVVSGAIAAIGGAGLLHGFRWARWVCIIWMAFHVVLSMWHSMIEVAFHLVMLAGLIFILFRKRNRQIIDA